MPQMCSRWYILIPAVLLMLYACVAYDTFREGEIVDAENVEIVRFDYEFGFLYLNVEIEEKEYRFIIDSGSPTAIHPRIATAHGLEVEKREKMRDVNGVVRKIDVVVLDHLKFGGVELADIRAGVVDLDVFTCLGIDGFIGANAMRFFDWHIDYENETAILYRNGFPENKLDVYLGPFRLDISQQFSPYLNEGQFKFDSIEFEHALVDIGSGGSVAVMLPHGFPLEGQDDLQWVCGEANIGAFGPATDTSYSFVTDKITIGDYCLPPTTLYSESHIQAALGNGFFDCHTLLLSWHEEAMYLSDAEELKEGESPEPRREKIGLKMDDDGIVVRAFSGPGKISDLGISCNDKVVSVNGVEATNLSEADLCDLRVMNEAVVLRIKKATDGEVVEVKEVYLR